MGSMMLRYLNPLNWMRWTGEFVASWFVSIPSGNLPKAMPAIVLMIGLLISGVMAWSDGGGWRRGLIERQLTAAWQKDDFATAELVLRRQLQATPGNRQLQYRLALARDAQDEHEEATAMMRQLAFAGNADAEEDGEQPAIAHFNGDQAAARWLLKEQYLGQNWNDLSEEQRQEFGALLKLIHDQQPDDMQINQLYADYLIAGQRLADAVPLLDQLARYQPMRGLQAAAISRQLGNTEQAERFGERTLTDLSQRLEDDPTNAMLALAVARSQLFLHRYEEAVQTLQTAVRRAKTDEDRQQLSQATGDAIVAWVAFLDDSSNETPAGRVHTLRMLQAALRVAPNNPRVLTLIADHVLATAGEQDKQVETLRQSLIEGSSPGISHFIQGTAALMNDDADKATMHLKIAAKTLPNSGAILNNLAVAMTAREDANLQQALTISETAIEQTPNPTPHYYETRGQILYRMQRYVDAIPDLERALSVPQLAPKAHESLAECYAQLGEESLSEQHRLAAAKAVE